MSDELLIQGKIHLVGRDAAIQVLLIVYLVDGLPQRLEILLYGLVDQHIAVGEIEHLLHQTRFQQTIHNLEGCIGLARSRCHDEQQAVAALCHGIHRAVDGITLVIARREDVLSRAIRLLYDLHLLIGHSLSVVDFGEISCVKLFLGWEFIHPQCTFLARKEVVFLEAQAIRAIGKRDVHHFGIFLGLLQAERNGVVGIFGLHDGNGRSAVVIQHIVGIFRLAAHHHVTSQVNLAIGKLHQHLHRDVLKRPVFAENGWRDKAQFDVFFG